MDVSDAELREVARQDAPGIRFWLRNRSQYSDGSAHYWWENIMMRALLATYRCETESDRRDFARLASAATEEAISGAEMKPYDGAIRLANLAGAYLRREGADRTLLDVDSIVERCLGLISVSFDTASSRTENWMQLPIEQIRELRYAKNLAGACDAIADRVTDPELSRRLSEWLRLKEKLP